MKIVIFTFAPRILYANTIFGMRFFSIALFEGRRFFFLLSMLQYFWECVGSERVLI